MHSVLEITVDQSYVCTLDKCLGRYVAMYIAS